MLPYQTLINLDRTIAVPLYVQICNSFIGLISQEILKTDDVMPSSRKLAEILKINRNTANLAYEELISQGWAESIDRKGTFVTTNLPAAINQSAPEISSTFESKSGFSWNSKFDNTAPVLNLQKINLAIDDGFPDVRMAPIKYLTAEYRSISKRFVGKTSFKYGNPKGSENLRNATCRYLGITRGISAKPENIVTTQGTQMGLYLTAQLLLEPGDVVAVGNSNYQAADATFLFCKARLLRIPIDENGMNVDYLEAALENTKIKAVYVIPHHHCPTTVTLSLERRIKLLQLAKKYSFAIIEDDYTFEFQYEDAIFLPLASMDQNQNVIHIGSFSKAFAPSLKTGFILGPEKFIDAAASLRKLIDRQGDTLLEEALASLLNNGEIARHFRKSVKVYRERRDIFCEILATEFNQVIEFKKPTGGLAVWSEFEKKINLSKMSEMALQKGLYINNGDFYKNEAFQTNSLRLGFASLEVNEMEHAFGILKKIIQQ